MKRESLVGVRTMREVGGSLDLARRAPKAKGQLTLFRAPAEPPPIDGPQIARLLRRDKERRRKQDSTLAQCQGKILRTREKLRAITERNRRLMEHRHQAEAQRWASTSSAGPPCPSSGGDVGGAEHGKGTEWPTRKGDVTPRKTSPRSR